MITSSSFLYCRLSESSASHGASVKALRNELSSLALASDKLALLTLRHAAGWSIRRLIWHKYVNVTPVGSALFRLDLDSNSNITWSDALTRWRPTEQDFFMPSEETPLLSTDSDRNDVYLRFSPTRKKIILVTVSACGLLNCMFIDISNNFILIYYNQSLWLGRLHLQYHRSPRIWIQQERLSSNSFLFDNFVFTKEGSFPVFQHSC